MVAKKLTLEELKKKTKKQLIALCKRHKLDYMNKDKKQLFRLLKQALKLTVKKRTTAASVHKKAAKKKGVKKGVKKAAKKKGAKKAKKGKKRVTASSIHRLSIKQLNEDVTWLNADIKARKLKLKPISKKKKDETKRAYAIRVNRAIARLRRVESASAGSA